MKPIDAVRSNLQQEIAVAAACLVVEDGLAYASAKRRALRQLGLDAHTALPDDAALEAAVRAHIALYCAPSQAAELKALRETALHWMERLAHFRPHLCGSVWHGSATRHSDIELELFCDDPKSAEWALIDQRLDYRVSSRPGELTATLCLRTPCIGLGRDTQLLLRLRDLDRLRGALKPDAQGRKPRADAQALRSRLQQIEDDRP